MPKGTGLSLKARRCRKGSAVCVAVLPAEGRGIDILPRLKGVQGDLVLEPGSHEAHGEVEAGIELSGCALEERVGIAELGFVARGMRNWACDPKIIDFLVGLPLREGDPKQHLSLSVLDVRDVDLVGKSEGAGGRSLVVGAGTGGVNRQNKTSCSKQQAEDDENSGLSHRP